MNAVWKWMKDKPGVRARESGIQRDRPLEQPGSGSVVDAIEAIHVLQAEVVGRPRIEILDRRQARERGLVHRDPDLERREDLGTDLLAHRVHIVDAAGKAIGPDDAAVRGIDQLDGDDELLVRDLDRARQAVAHAQQPADLAEIGLRGTQAERRAAGRDEQPAQARELGDQFVGQRTGERRVAPRSPTGETAAPRATAGTFARGSEP